MHITIKATHMDLTDAIRSYVEEKVAMLEKVLDANDTTIRVDVEVETLGDQHSDGATSRAEINLHVGGTTYRSTQEHGDLYAAIDMVKDEMLEQLTRAKDKQATRSKQEGARLKEIMQTEEYE